MRHVKSHEEYVDVVLEIKDEYETEVETDPYGIAVTHVASFGMHGCTPTIHDSVEYRCETSTALDEALNPYDIIQHSDEKVPMDQPEGMGDTACQRAAQSLMRDLIKPTD